jgi:hypothetical protein
MPDIEEPKTWQPPNGTNKVIRLFGRAPGFMALALIQTACAMWLAFRGASMEGFATALWPINIGIYGGGGAKALAGRRGESPC